MKPSTFQVHSFCFRLFFWFVLLFVPFTSSWSQDFMMQGWYWDYPKTASGHNWADTLNARAAELGNACFTYLWLPPLSRASFGSNSNGYDPQDLYDLGEYGLGPTGFGTRTDVDDLIAALNSNGVKAVADVVYNHRDGGDPETNQAVEDYITTHYNASKNPFPSDRWRCVLPLTAGAEGDYYFKVSSKSGSSQFHNKAYKIYVETSAVGWQGLSDASEAEPNGGGDCGQGFNDITLGRNFSANIDASGCTVDEFHLELNTGDFNPSGDSLFIYLTNPNGDYSDHRIYGIWHAPDVGSAGDIVGDLDYQTYTDFTNMPSGQGAMNFENFRPNSGNTASTFLSGDWDWLWFFYDYDQDVVDTQNKLFDWTSWLFNDVGIEGLRMDAVKHFNPAFLGALMDHMDGQGLSSDMVVGEFFDFNPGTLKGWVDEVYSNMSQTNIDVRVFDFSMRSALKEACDNGAYDTRNVFNSGVVNGAGGSGFNVVTFLNNHDFRDGGQPVQSDPMLGYAYLLTNNQIGLPCVFYSDYFGSTIPNAPTVNLKTPINELIELHKLHITGAPSIDYLNRFSTPYASNYISAGNGADASSSLIYQISGGVSGEEIIVAINFSNATLQVDHELNMGNLSVGQEISDYLGNSNFPLAVVSASNQIYIELPPRSYSVWVTASALPVDLLKFSANAQQNVVDLHWLTLAEENFSHFEVERSLDGRNFQQVDLIKAKGTEGLEQNYWTQDKQVPFNQDLYYRLKMVDLDGQFDYSEVELVRLDAKNQSLQIQPNPLIQKGHLIFRSEETSNIELTVYNAQGQLMRSWRESVSRGSNDLTIDLGQLENGVYQLVLQQGEQTWSETFVKQQ
ncbi:MAG: alpha-amylase family glycosyl hydrolase [Bacteroidota bacterium]